MEEIRVVSWGLGAMGSGIARALHTKAGIKAVGAIDQDPGKIGKDLGEVVNEKPWGIKIQDEFNFTSKDADLVMLATSSFTREVYPLVEQAVKAGLNVITIAEEMAYPWANNPELADKIDNLARENGVSVLGTGINPGFVLDTLILAMTGVCLDVERIEARRVNDLSPFGPTVMKTQGVGTTPEEFAAGLEAGTIVGHIGFKESLSMIAESLGWELDEIKQTREPIITNTYRETQYVKVEPGMVAGCNHIAYGIKDGKKIIVLEHPQQIKPELEDIKTGDYINIIGDPDINLSIKPEILGGKGTQAIAVNMMPAVVAARTGLLTMKDLPIPYFLPKMAE